MGANPDGLGREKDCITTSVFDLIVLKFSCRVLHYATELSIFFFDRLHDFRKSLCSLLYSSLYKLTSFLPCNSRVYLYLILLF